MTKRKDDGHQADFRAEDLGFARLYVDYIARRSSSPEERARAQILLGLITMLDQRFPGWQSVFLAELTERGNVPEVSDIFKLPQGAEDQLSDSFVANSLNNAKKE